MEAIYGLENLVGLGYKWSDAMIYYAIGLKGGKIDGADFEMEIPDDGWTTVNGMTEDLKKIYDRIYKDGRLRMELESFFSDGRCEIKFLR